MKTAKHLWIAILSMGLIIFLPGNTQGNNPIQLAPKPAGSAYIVSNYLSDNNKNDLQGEQDTFSKKGLTAKGVINTNNILFGITDFAIEASKRELNIAFFQKFEKFLDENPEAKTMFPATLRQLEKIKSFQFNEFLPTLRRNFFEDLNSFPGNITQVLALPKYQQLFKNMPELRVGIKMMAILADIRNGEQEPHEILNSIAEIEEFKAANLSDKKKALTNLATSIKMANIISLAFVDPDNDMYYDAQVLKELLKEQAFIDELLKGISAESSGLAFYKKDGTVIKVDEVTKNIEKLALTTYCYNLVSAIQQMQEAIGAVRSPAVGGVLSTPEDKKKLAIAVLDGTLDCLEACGGFLNMIPEVDYQPYWGIAQTLFQIPKDAINENYPAVASNSINLITSVLELSNSGAGEDGNETINKALKIMGQLAKYSNLAANIVEAKSPEEVKNAIEAAALPPGSSSIKKNSIFNISLQMHLGGAVKIHNFTKNESFPSWQNRFNVTLPIGVSFNKGLGKAGSLGIFASVLDLGALAQFRIGNDTTIEETIRFQNVFSPAVYLSYGFGGNLPLSLNIGGQYGPGLTKVTLSNLEIEKPTWRFLVSLTVDIPVLTLYNAPEKRTKTKNGAYVFEKPKKEKNKGQQKQ